MTLERLVGALILVSLEIGSERRRDRRRGGEGQGRGLMPLVVLRGKRINEWIDSLTNAARGKVNICVLKNSTCLVEDTRGGTDPLGAV